MKHNADRFRSKPAAPVSLIGLEDGDFVFFANGEYSTVIKVSREYNYSKNEYYYQIELKNPPPGRGALMSFKENGMPYYGDKMSPVIIKTLRST